MMAASPPDEWSKRRATAAAAASRRLARLGLDIPARQMLHEDDVPSLDWVDDDRTEEVHRDAVEALIADRDTEGVDRLH